MGLARVLSEGGIVLPSPHGPRGTTGASAQLSWMKQTWISLNFQQTLTGGNTRGDNPMHFVLVHLICVAILEKHASSADRKLNGSIHSQLAARGWAEHTHFVADSDKLI